VKVYLYAGCGTCRKAVKFLATHNVSHTAVPIREQPPTKAELKRMLAHYGGEVRKLFNTSGQDYKRLNMKERLPQLTSDAALDLLAGNGNLVKRPFALTSKNGLVGFNEEAWLKLIAR